MTMLSREQRLELKKRILELEEANVACLSDVMSKRLCTDNAVRAEKAHHELLRYIDVEL